LGEKEKNVVVEVGLEGGMGELQCIFGLSEKRNRKR